MHAHTATHSSPALALCRREKLRADDPEISREDEMQSYATSLQELADSSCLDGSRAEALLQESGCGGTKYDCARVDATFKMFVKYLLGECGAVADSPYNNAVVEDPPDVSVESYEAFMAELDTSNAGDNALRNLYKSGNAQTGTVQKGCCNVAANRHPRTVLELRNLTSGSEGFKALIKIGEPSTSRSDTSPRAPLHVHPFVHR